MIAQDRPGTPASTGGFHTAMRYALLLGLASSAMLGACDCESDDPVDSTPVGLKFTAPADNSSFEEGEDANASKAGFQAELTLEVEGISAGEVRLSAAVAGEDVHDDVTLTVDGGTLKTSDLTLLPGQNTVEAVLVSADGASLVNATLTLTLRMDDPELPDITLTFPTEGQVISPADDVDPDQDGIQLDVLAELAQVPEGSELVLTVNGDVVAEDDSEGTNHTFDGITLPEGNVNLTATVTTDGGQDSDRVNVVVEVPAEECTVTLEPEPVDGVCDFSATSEDEDPDALGFQTSFVVRTNCDRAQIEVNGAVGDFVEVDQDDNLARVQVTLEEGANTVSAIVSRFNGDDTINTDPQTYNLDSVAPGVSFSFPEAGRLLTFANVGDDNTEDGLNFELTAEATGLEGEVSVLVNGDERGTAAPDEEGRLRFALVITADDLDDNSQVALGLTAADDCGNEGSAEITVPVSLSTSSLAITAPEDNVNFGPLDDQDGALDGLQTDFTVEAVDVDDETPVWIECRNLIQEAYLRRSEDAPLVAGAATVRVTLPDGAYNCRAVSTDPALVSADILVGASLIVELVQFTTPSDGDQLNEPTLDVSASTVNVEAGTQARLEVGEDTYNAAVRDGGVVFPGVELDEGDNTLAITIESEQAPSATIAVVLDTLPPEITFTFPSVDDAELGPDDDNNSDLEDGFAIDATFQVTGAPEGAEVCVQTLTSQTRCGAVDADGNVTVVGLELAEGDTTLDVTVEDALGNEGSASLPVTVITGRPQIRVASPVNGSATAQDSVSVSITTDFAAGVEVSLFVNGADTPASVQETDENGVARFDAVTLDNDGENTLRASGMDDRGLGWSPTSVIVVDTTVPGVVFVAPVDGQIFNANALDLDGAPGFQTDVVFASEGIADDQPASLTVDCGDGFQTYEATLNNSRATFARVTLRDASTCTLTGQVTSLAGLTGEGSINLQVDREAPVLRFPRIANGSILNINDDLEPATDGLQQNVRVAFEGLEVGNTIALTDEAGTIDLVSEPIVEGTTSVVFGPVTLPNGDVTLIATATDSAGNEAVAEVRFLVDDSNLVINLTSPSNNSIFNANDDLDHDTDGFQVRFVASSVAALKDNPVRLCSDAAPDGAAPCETGGYGVVAETTFQGDAAGATFELTLNQGLQTLLAESRLVEDNQLITSPPVTVTVDSERPEIVALTLVSDSVEPTGLVGSLEDRNGASPGFAATFRVETSGLEADGSVFLYEVDAPNVVLAGARLDGGDTVDINLNLQEGTYNLFANAADAVGNQALMPPVLTFEVDVTAPTLSLDNVVEGQAFNAAQDADTDAPGLQFAFNGSSDEIGATVTLWVVTGTLDPFDAVVDDMMIGTATVTEAGTFAFSDDVQLPDGMHTLAVRTTDAASNRVDAQVNIVIDVGVPTITITTPDTGTTLTEEAEVFQGRPGFQAALTVTGDTPGLAVQIVNLATETPIGDPVMLGQDGSADAVVTLSRGLNQLEARVTDDLGNQGRSEAYDITVDIAGCGIVFNDPLETLLRISEDNDNDPNNGVEVRFETIVADIGTCLGQPVQLFVDGNEVASTPLGADGIVAFEAVVFPNSSNSTVLAQIDDGAGNVTATSLVNVLVDLIPPTVAIDAPAEAAVFAQVDDQGGAPGLQTSLTLNLANADGGTFTVTTDASADPVVEDVAVGMQPQTVANVTLPEGAQAITVTVTDLVGVEAEATVNIVVDLTSPDALVLTETINNPRLGALDLAWAAPGDDGMVGDVTRYEVRRATDPIEDMADFMAATLVGSPDPSVANGEEESFSIESLPWTPPQGSPSITHYLAVVAFDDVGNASLLGDNVEFTQGLTEATFGADNSGGAFGAKSFPIGDINNDGFADLSAFDNRVGGGSFIVYGRADVGALDATTPNVQELTPEADAFPLFGNVATALGDINGDGVDDFAVSALFDDGGRGKVYVYFGEDGVAAIDGAPDVTIQGPGDEGSFHFFGSSLSVAENFADEAGEGLPDLLIGSYFTGNTGAAFVVLGRETWPATLDADEGGNGVLSITGAASGDQFGYAVASMGDLDDDGFSEIAVSAPFRDAEDGAVFLFAGGTAADLTAAVDGVELAPHVQGGRFGLALKATDLNADDKRELVVGAPIGNDGVAIFSFDAALAGTQEAAFVAPKAGQLVAEQIDTPDINGDGLPDVVLGGAFTSGSDGRVSIFFNDDGAFGTTDSLRYQRSAKWGNDVTNIGDFNGDGYDDLAVAVPEMGEGSIVILY